MNNIDILEELKPKKIDLITLIRAFKKEGIDDFIVIRKEKFETLIAKNKELEEENEEWKAIFDMGNSRTYRKKYIEERRKEQPNLLYPDFDEVYQKYFELRKERDNLKMDLTDVYLDGIYDERTKWKEKIKKELAELQSMNVDGEMFKTSVNYAINILQSLLGKE